MSEQRKRSLPVIPPELRDEQLPHGAFSNSQYEMYKKCPKQWEFRYVKGLKRPPKAEMIRGLSVHAGTETAHLFMIEHQAIPPADLTLQAAADRFEQDRKTVENWEDHKPDQVKDTALNLVKVYHHQALPLIQPVSAEEPFATRVGTVPMMGFIDRVDCKKEKPIDGVEDPGTYIVFDTKTSSAKWSQNDVAFDTQLTLYSIVKDVYHVGIDNLVPLKGGPAYHRLPSVRDAHAKRIYLEDLEETVDLVKKGIFPKTSIDHWACTAKWCGYYDLCRGKRT